MVNIWTHIKDLISARELLFAIAGRSVQVRYKQSLLGVAWAVVQPLVQMLVFTLVFSMFAKVPSEGVPYPIFAFSALLPWTFFAAATSTAASSIVNNASLITKVRLPTEVFPLGSILARGVDLGIAAIILAAMMIFYQVPLTLYVLWSVPLLFVQVLFMTGLCLLLSAVNVFYRDIDFMVGLGLQLWMYVSPVAYPVGIVPESYRGLYMLNPIAPIVDGYRKAIVHGAPPDLEALRWVVLAALTFLVLGYWFFKSQEKKFADVV